MVLLPGCTCCGDKCKPCPYCTDEECFKITFSGFSQLPNTFSDCSDCRHLDNTSIIVRTHQAPNPAVTLTVTDSSGTGATFSNTLTTNEDNSLSVSSASVTAGGSGYLSPVLVATPTESWDGALLPYATSIVCKQPTATFTLGENGTITGLTITDGGEIWPGVRIPVGAASLVTSPCGYSGGVCGGCPGTVFVSFEEQLFPGTRPNSIGADLVFGNEDHSVHVTSPSGVSVTGLARAINSEGEVGACNSVSFQSSKVTGCHGNGTITVESVSCSEEPVSPCPMPEQIALRVTWPAYTWSGGVPGVPPPFYCSTYLTDSEASDETYILDRQTSFPIFPFNHANSLPCSTYYKGPVIPWTGYAPVVNFNATDNIVTATISPPDVPPAWYINPPERRTATAEVIGISGDHLTQITVTDGGEGYQYEIQQRVAPTVTLTADDSDGGSGASFTATLEQVGTGDAAVWGIKSVTVVNGGTGYPESGAVNVTTAEGQTTVEAAGLTFLSAGGVITSVAKDGVQARRPPTVTVAGTSGSGAVLTPNVVGDGGTWNIDSVTVVSGGTGYVDREPAVFTFAEPETTVVCVPKGVVETVLEQPQITGVVWLTEGEPDAGIPPVTGTGAVFDVSSLVMESAEPFIGDYSCKSPRPRWRLAGEFGTDRSEIIVSGGSGYEVWNILRFSFAGPGVPPYPAEYDPDFPELYVSSVDENGAITGIAVVTAGRIARDTGVINRIATSQNNCPYLPTYIPATRCPTGVFYIEDETVPVGKYFAVQPTGQTHTSVPTITINAKIGSGATATASVSNGAVSSISVTNGGSGYSPQRVAWIVTVDVEAITPTLLRGGVGGANPAQPIFYMGSGFEGLPCSGASPLSDRLSENCPADLFGSYLIGSVSAPTLSTSTSGAGCSAPHLVGQCASLYGSYGITNLPRRYFLTGTAEITAVDP